MKNYFKKKKRTKKKGISMLALVITIVVIIIIALVAFAASTRMVDEANYSTYSNNFSEVETFFEKTSVNMHGKGESALVMNVKGIVKSRSESFVDHPRPSFLPYFFSILRYSTLKSIEGAFPPSLYAAMPIFTFSSSNS